MALTLANHCAGCKAAARRLIDAIEGIEPDGDWRLEIDDLGLTLATRLNGQPVRWQYSFSDPALRRRAVQRNQGLLKACNTRRRDIRSVLDLTAGWGRDSFLLAASGHQVTLVEQQPLIAACIDFLLQIARADDPDSPCHRMRLLTGDGRAVLQSGETADCLYLDPMFPPHKSGARPGKELQLLQQLTANRNVEGLFRHALAADTRRVVVKRPLHAPPLAGEPPDLNHREKTVRFDIYLRP